MIVATTQPYFAPFGGFFFKAARADVLVVLDTVQFPRGFTWLTRNRFKNNRGALWISVPVWRRGLGLQRIDEVKICWEGRWPGKHLASLMTAYADAPFLSDHADFLKEIFDGRYEKLVDLNMATIRQGMSHLGIRTRLAKLSEMGIAGKGSDLLVRICKTLQADRFVAQRPARKFLVESAFAGAGIEVRFIDPPVPVYPQLWGNFLPNLSVLDLMFNCGPTAAEILFKDVDPFPTR